MRDDRLGGEHGSHRFELGLLAGRAQRLGNGDELRLRHPLQTEALAGEQSQLRVLGVERRGDEALGQGLIRE